MDRKLVLFAAVALVVLAVWLAVPQAQSAGEMQFQYLELEWADYRASTNADSLVLEACQLAADPVCRRFPPGRGQDLRSVRQQAVAVLGSEGWELVTILREDAGAGDYQRWVFKRAVGRAM